MIKRVRLTNFKSLQDVTVDLEPVTVLIGKSGAGKTNFVEALRWVRDYLGSRNFNFVNQRLGGWHHVLSATCQKPANIAISLTFGAPGLSEDFQYELQFQQQNANTDPVFAEEKLCLGQRILLHQSRGKWLHAPPLVNPPRPGTPMLGALTGIQEVTVAHVVLTSGIGCYAFPDYVLTAPKPKKSSEIRGFADHGENFLQAYADINNDLTAWQNLRGMAASLRLLKPSLKNLDLEQPGGQKIVVSLEADSKLLVLDLGQESEGFRRMLACLIALNQSPPKQTVIFDEPEKGIYPVGLAILADEFKAYASKGRGQVLLTTHSPEFLDHFAPEQIRVVEMRGFTTHIGPVAPEQMEALREQFIKPGELLTVDEARLAEAPAGAV
jgi:predicted ATP-dependent endonuclease of OLD family